MKSKKAKILLEQKETAYLGGFASYDKSDVIEIIEEVEKEYLDQINSLRAALVAKDETYMIKEKKLKEKALNAFLECEGYDEFEREINS